jgi:hypothetical protein
MLKVTMSREEAEKLFAEQGQELRDLSASRRIDLVAFYRQLLAADQIEILWGGPRTKDELISAILELRFPRSQVDEMTHVLYHQPGDVWSACGHCGGADYVPRSDGRG